MKTFCHGCDTQWEPSALEMRPNRCGIASEYCSKCDIFISDSVALRGSQAFVMSGTLDKPDGVTIAKCQVHRTLA
jgi:hypothetical protein